MEKELKIIIHPTLPNMVDAPPAIYVTTSWIRKRFGDNLMLKYIAAGDFEDHRARFPRNGDKSTVEVRIPFLDDQEIEAFKRGDRSEGYIDEIWDKFGETVYIKTHLGNIRTTLERLNRSLGPDNMISNIIARLKNNPHTGWKGVGFSRDGTPFFSLENIDADEVKALRTILEERNQLIHDRLATPVKASLLHFLQIKPPPSEQDQIAISLASLCGARFDIDRPPRHIYSAGVSTDKGFASLPCNLPEIQDPARLGDDSKKNFLRAFANILTDIFFEIRRAYRVGPNVSLELSGSVPRFLIRVSGEREFADCKVLHFRTDVEFVVTVTHRYLDEETPKFRAYSSEILISPGDEIPDEAFISDLVDVVRSNAGIKMEAETDRFVRPLLCKGTVRFVRFIPAAGKNAEAPRRKRTKTREASRSPRHFAVSETGVVHKTRPQRSRSRSRR